MTNLLWALIVKRYMEEGANLETKMLESYPHGDGRHSAWPAMLNYHQEPY